VKKAVVILSVVLLLFSISACGMQKTIYTVSAGGRTLTVDTQKQTVQDGLNTYRYTFSGDSEKYTIGLIYPDGYTCRISGNGVHSGSYAGLGDAGPDSHYASPDALRNAILQSAPDSFSPTKIFIILFLVVIGILDVAAPRAVWFLGYGWRYKDAEPSDTVLILNRVAGAISILVGICLIFT